MSTHWSWPTGRQLRRGVKTCLRNHSQKSKKTHKIGARRENYLFNDRPKMAKNGERGGGIWGKCICCAWSRKSMLQIDSVAKSRLKLRHRHRRQLRRVRNCFLSLIFEARPGGPPLFKEKRKRNAILLALKAERQNCEITAPWRKRRCLVVGQVSIPKRYTFRCRDRPHMKLMPECRKKGRFSKGKTKTNSN